MTHAARLAILFLTLFATSVATAVDAPVRLVPSTLDLGEWGAGGATSASAWLINTGDEPVGLTRIDVDADGLTLKPVTARTIAPAGAIELRVTLTADEVVDAVRTRRVTAYVDGQSPLSLAVTVRSIHPDVHLAPPAVDRHRWSTVRATPPRLDFSPAAPGERKEGSIWLVNTADTPARLIAAKGGCGCIEFPGFEPMTIDPGSAVELRPTMIAQGEIGSHRYKFSNFVFETLDPLPVEFHMDIIDPRVSKLHQFIAAEARGDLAAMRVCMTLDSRIWHGTRVGPGVARTPEGAAPTAAWDAVMNTRREYRDFHVEGDTVTVTVSETSDLRRLAGCPPRTDRYTYFFTADRQIEGLLVGAPADDAPDTCLAEFLEWASEHHPKALATIYANGRATRTVEAAPRWRAALSAWRRETGRPPVDLEVAP